MCLAIPGKILEVFEGYGRVDIMGLEKIVNLQLIENPKVDELILVHAGCGIERIHPEYYGYIEDMLQKLLDDSQDGPEDE